MQPQYQPFGHSSSGTAVTLFGLVILFIFGLGYRAAININDEGTTFFARQKALRQGFLTEFVNKVVNREVKYAAGRSKRAPLEFLDGNRHLPVTILQTISRGNDLDSSFADARYALRAALRTGYSSTEDGILEKLAIELERPYMDVFNKIHTSETVESLRSIQLDTRGLPQPFVDDEPPVVTVNG